MATAFGEFGKIENATWKLPWSCIHAVDLKNAQYRYSSLLYISHNPVHKCSLRVKIVTVNSGRKEPICVYRHFLKAHFHRYIYRCNLCKFWVSEYPESSGTVSQQFEIVTTTCWLFVFLSSPWVPNKHLLISDPSPLTLYTTKWTRPMCRIPKETNGYLLH